MLNHRLALQREWPKHTSSVFSLGVGGVEGGFLRSSSFRGKAAPFCSHGACSGLCAVNTSIYDLIASCRSSFSDPQPMTGGARKFSRSQQNKQVNEQTSTELSGLPRVGGSGPGLQVPPWPPGTRSPTQVLRGPEMRPSP